MSFRVFVLWPTFKKSLPILKHVCLLGIYFDRPGGMEKPGDDFEQTHNVRVASKDTLFGGVVSRLQVS